MYRFHKTNTAQSVNISSLYGIHCTRCKSQRPVAMPSEEIPIAFYTTSKRSRQIHFVKSPPQNVIVQVNRQTRQSDYSQNCQPIQKKIGDIYSYCISKRTYLLHKSDNESVQLYTHKASSYNLTYLHFLLCAEISFTCHLQNTSIIFFSKSKQLT